MEENIERGETEVPAEEGLRSATTAHEHYMAMEDETTAVCALGCGHGCTVDATEKIVDGKIVPRTAY